MCRMCSISRHGAYQNQDASLDPLKSDSIILCELFGDFCPKCEQLRSLC